MEDKRRSHRPNTAVYYIGYLIEYEYFSIGLDKIIPLVYIKNMKFNVFSRKVELKKNKLGMVDKGDLVAFVFNQFKELSKKNLNVPIKLYHL